jgi:phage gp29-like protein
MARNKRTDYIPQNTAIGPMSTKGSMAPMLPGFPSNNWGMEPTDIPSWGSTGLDQRVVLSDPRDLWFLSLPWKLEPQRCINIIRAALGGDLWQQWQLLSQMLTSWPTFRMAQHQLREAAAYTKYVFNPYAEDGKEPTQEAVDKAGLAGKAFRGMSPNQFTDEKGASGMVYDFADAMLNGVSMTELIWGKTGKGLNTEWMPRASAWVHPRHLTFTEGGAISVYTEDYGQMYPDMRLQSQYRTIGKTPPENKFICSQFISRSGSSLGAGFMQPLVWAWSARQFNAEWMLNTAKKFGSPFLDMTFRVKENADAERKALEAYAVNAGTERAIVHPEGTEVKVYPAQTLGADNPQRWLYEETDRMCLFLLLGQASTTMATPGKLGEEGTKADVKDERVMGLAGWLARNPVREFARAVCRVNFKDDSEAPNIEPDFTKPLTSAQVGALATALTNSQLAVRADEAYRKFGLTQPQAGDVIIQHGKLVEMSEIVTQDQLAQIEQEAQAYEQAVNQSQGGAGSGREVEAAGQAYRGLRTVLATASKDQFEELEAAVVKCRASGTGNGEWHAVKHQIKHIAETNRINLYGPTE